MSKRFPYIIELKNLFSRGSKLVSRGYVKTENDVNALFVENGYSVKAKSFLEDAKRSKGFVSEMWLSVLGVTDFIERFEPEITPDQFITTLESIGITDLEIEKLSYYSQDLASLPNTLLFRETTYLYNGVKTDVATTVANLSNSVYRGEDGKLYFESHHSNIKLIMPPDRDHLAGILNPIPGEVKAVFELTENGPRLVSVKASNQLLSDVIEADPAEGFLITDELIQKANVEELANAQSAVGLERLPYGVAPLDIPNESLEKLSTLGFVIAHNQDEQRSVYKATKAKVYEELSRASDSNVLGASFSDAVDPNREPDINEQLELADQSIVQAGQQPPSEEELKKLSFHSQNLYNFSIYVMQQAFPGADDQGQFKYQVKSLHSKVDLIRGHDGELYFVNTRSFKIQTGVNDDGPIYAYLPGQVKTVFRYTNEGPVLQYAEASNPLLKHLLTAKPGSVTELTDAMIQEAEAEEQKQHDAKALNELAPQDRYSSDVLYEVDMQNILGALYDKRVEPGSRASELDRVSWSLAGVDRNVYINKKQAQLDENAEQNNVDVPLNPLVVGMDAYIQAFIENKVPADYLDGMPNRNTVIRDWILANLFMPHTVYADIASVGGLDQELMLSQLSQDVPVDMTVDFVPGEGLVIHFNRAFIPRDQDQNVLVDEKHYPSLTVKMTANISAQDPNGAHYKLQYSSQLDPVLSKAVGERAKLASLRLKPHSYSYVTPASDRAVAALPQQNQNGEQDQVHYYALMSYRDVLNKPANERQTKLSELQPQLENITLSSPPILQTVKRNFELEKHFVDLQVRVDQTEETLKAYLEQIKGITDDDFKDDHGVVSYDLSRLSNKQQKDPKVYSAVLALGMIQKFKQQASTPVIKDYRAMLMALDGVLIRNNNKKHWWQGNRFSDGFGYKSLANGETKIVALKNNKAALEARGYTVVAGVNAALDRQSRYAGTFASDVAFELKAFEQAQHKIHQDAKSFIFSSDLDPKKSVLGRLSTDGNVVRARRHVHDLARALVNAKDTAALAVVKQRVDAIYGEAALADASEEVQALRQAYSKHDVERGADKLYLENITAVIKAKFTAIEKINSPDQGAVLDRSYLSDVFNVFSHAVDAAFEKMKPGNSVYEVDAPAFDEIAAGAYKALNAVLDQRDAILDAVKAQYQSTLNTIVETAKAAIADKDPAEVVETIAAAETEIGEVASPADLDQGDKAKLISDSQSQLAIMKKDRLVAILKNKVETIKQQLVTNISDLVSAQQLGDLEAYRQKALLDIDQFAFIESGLTPAVAEKVIAPFRQAISAAVKEKREAIIREPQPVPEEWQSSVEVPGGLKALYTVFENAVISRHTESKSSEQELLAIYNDRVKAFYPNPRDSDAVSKEVKSVISKANLKKFDRGYEERKGQHSFGAEERDLRLVKREQSEASRRPRSVSLSESHFGLLANANKGLELSASKDDLELLPRTRPVLPTR